MQTSFIIRTISLPLRHPFTIAHGTWTVQENVLVELRAGRRSGYGEAATLAYYGVTAASIRQALEERGAASKRRSGTTRRRSGSGSCRRLGHNRFALAALDEAAHDLWGKRLGRPVHRLWGLDPQKIPTERLHHRHRHRRDHAAEDEGVPGWPVYKIARHPDDLGLVRQLRRHTTAAFRVDANRAGRRSGHRQL